MNQIFSDVSDKFMGLAKIYDRGYYPINFLHELDFIDNDIYARGDGKVCTLVKSIAFLSEGFKDYTYYE